MQQVIIKEKLKKAHQIAGQVGTREPKFIITDVLLQKAKKALFDLDIEKFVSKKDVTAWK